jgi:hypothetical protein
VNPIVSLYLLGAAAMFLLLGFCKPAFESRAELYREAGDTIWIRLTWFGFLALASFFWPFSIAAWIAAADEEES